MFAVILLAAAVTLPASVSGDFDRDGKLDVAEVVRLGDGAYALTVRRGGSSGAASVVDRLDSDGVRNLYLARAAPGRRMTWCGKGGGPQGAACPRKSVTLVGDTLSFGTLEASELVALWNGRGFEVVALSD